MANINRKLRSVMLNKLYNSNYLSLDSAVFSMLSTVLITYIVNNQQKTRLDRNKIAYHKKFTSSFSQVDLNLFSHLYISLLSTDSISTELQGRFVLVQCEIILKTYSD